MGERFVSNLRLSFPDDQVILLSHTSIVGVPFLIVLGPRQPFPTNAVPPGKLRHVGIWQVDSS